MKDIISDNSAITCYIAPNNSTLVIAFGGINRGFGIPPFEFLNILDSYDVSKMFVRDFEQAWYHKGLTNISESIDETARFFVEKIKESFVVRPKIVMFGNSMGGYAALLFGSLIEADIVYAFSPQTFIDKYNRTKFNDTRWSPKIDLLNQSMEDSPYLDLLSFFKTSNTIAKVYNIYYSTAAKLDKIHAEELSKVLNVNLYPYPEGGHGLVKYLRDQGILKQIIIDSLAK